MKLKSFFTPQNKRSALVLRNVYMSVFAKGGSVLISLFLVPLTINYVSSEMYGIWLTLTSIISWASFFDIGLGNGMRNRLAEALAVEDYEKGQKLVSTTYFFLSLIFVAFVLIMLFIVPFLDWGTLLNVKEKLPWVPLILIMVFMFSLQVVLQLITSVVTAMQQNAIASMIFTSGQLIALIGIYILTQILEPNLIYLTLCLMGLPNLIFLVASVYFYNFNYQYRQLRPIWRKIDRSYAKGIIQLGGQFFIIQICGILMYQTTNFIIMRICGSNEVTMYNVAFRYFSMITMIGGIVLAPIWTAYTNAYTRNDFEWMRRMYRYLLCLFFIGVLGGIVLLLLSDFFYYIWIGDSVKIPYTLSFSVMCFMIVLLWTSIHSSLLNGIGMIRVSVYITSLSIPVCIPLAILMGTLFGIDGIIFSTIIMNLPFSIIALIQVRKILNKKGNGIWIK